MMLFTKNLAGKKREQHFKSMNRRDTDRENIAEHEESGRRGVKFENYDGTTYSDFLWKNDTKRSCRRETKGNKQEIMVSQSLKLLGNHNYTGIDPKRHRTENHAARQGSRGSQGKARMEIIQGNHETRQIKNSVKIRNCTFAFVKWRNTQAFITDSIYPPKSPKNRRQRGKWEEIRETQWQPSAGFNWAYRGGQAWNTYQRKLWNHQWNCERNSLFNPSFLFTFLSKSVYSLDFVPEVCFFFSLFYWNFYFLFWNL